MKKILPLSIFFILTLSLQLKSHEGHDHDKPATAQAPKGGILKGNEDVYLEVVNKNSELKIYVYDKNLKALNDDDFSFKAIVKKPRIKGFETLTLEKNENLYSSRYDAKGLHRYTLTIEISSKKGKYTDKINFTIEPKG